MDTAEITIYGHDPALLATRKQILQRSGMAVRTTEDLAGLREESSKLLVLCYTLSDSEQVAGIEAARSIRPDVRVLVLDRDTPLHTREPYETISTFEGPAAFCRRVTELMGSS